MLILILILILPKSISEICRQFIWCGDARLEKAALRRGIILRLPWETLCGIIQTTTFNTAMICDNDYN